MVEDRDKFWQWFFDIRGVEVPCKNCGGAGVKGYGSTSTWHGVASGVPSAG